MKFLLSLSVIFLMTAESGAETYSWVDDSGTYNFTEDLSSVPKKYLKKVNRLGDMGRDSASQAPSSPEKKSDPPETPVEKPVSTPVEAKDLYKGKSYDAWRIEMNVQEAELTKLEKHLDEIYKESIKRPGLPRDQFEILRKDYDDTKAIYGEKYKVYSELIESARKAGLTVEIKK
jgi:hypothetical protein